MQISPTVDQETRTLSFTAALRNLSGSLFISALCPYLLYQYLAPRFPAASLVPLSCASAFPIFGLIFSLARRRVLDFIALLALLEVVVALVAIALSSSQSEALIGRSLPNAVLGVIFLVSVFWNRPIMRSIARQIVAGSDAGLRTRFDRIALTPNGLHVFRVITLAWTVALLVKCATSLWSAASLSAAHFMFVSPAFNYGLDLVVVFWSIRYGRSKLRPTE
jgi:hypothetical protein